MHNTRSFFCGEDGTGYPPDLSPGAPLMIASLSGGVDGCGRAHRKNPRVFTWTSSRVPPRSVQDPTNSKKGTLRIAHLAGVIVKIPPQTLLKAESA